MKLLWEILAWVAFSAVVGLLSVWPRFQVVETEKAIVKLRFRMQPSALVSAAS